MITELISETERRYPKRPLVGVGAIIFDGPRILMAQRGKQPLLGWWSLPGGALEAGELLADAVRREVLEETGLVVEPLGVIEIFERIMRDGAGVLEYHYVLIDYICRVTGGALQAGDDVRRVEWAPREALKQLQITEGTLGVIEKAFCQRRKYKFVGQPILAATGFQPALETSARAVLVSPRRRKAIPHAH